MESKTKRRYSISASLIFAGTVAYLALSAVPTYAATDLLVGQIPYPGDRDAVHLNEIGLDPQLQSKFANAALLEMWNASGGYFNIAYPLNYNIWKQSDFRQDWLAVARESNAFKRKRANDAIYQRMLNDAESVLAPDLKKLMDQEFYFVHPIKKKTDFDFESMSKAVEHAFTSNKNRKQNPFCTARLEPGVPLNQHITSTLSGDNEDRLWPVADLLPPTSGTYADRMYVSEQYNVCSLRFKFDEAGQAERFEEIVEGQETVLFYFVNIASVNSDESIALEISDVELWAKEPGSESYTKAPFSISVDGSMGVDEYYQYVADGWAANNGSGQRPDHDIRRLVTSEDIWTQKRERDRDTFIQFKDSGDRLYVLGEQDPKRPAMAKYIRREHPTGWVYELVGYMGPSMNDFATHIYLPTDPAEGVREQYGDTLQAALYAPRNTYTDYAGWVNVDEVMRGDIERMFNNNWEQSHGAGD